jgi:hypothetical protein
MAKHDPKWTPDTDGVPTTHPKTRDQLVQENRAGHTAEPPKDTDGNGDMSDTVAPSARTEPVGTYAVNAAETGEHGVRVGPGDTGAADTPTQMAEPVPGRNDTWGRAIGILVAVALIALIVTLLF